MPGDTALEVAILRKCYGTRPVLRDIRFQARPGEVLALLGASGAGKTTTLRIAMGLDTAFDGSVRRRAGRLGVVFQEPRLLPWLSTADNLRLVAADAPVAALLAEVGLAGAEQTMPRALSLGMARRAVLARAFAVGPTLLVLDEPFASLDPQRAGGLAAVVARRAQQHATAVLLATHDVGQALAIADRILVLAGQPATLAADLRRADHADTEMLRCDLLARFPFLVADPEADQPPLRR